MQSCVVLKFLLLQFLQSSKSMHAKGVYTQYQFKWLSHQSIPPEQLAIFTMITKGEIATTDVLTFIFVVHS